MFRSVLVFGCSFQLILVLSFFHGGFGDDLFFIPAGFVVCYNLGIGGLIMMVRHVSLL
jgi:hypothetical protein